MDHNNYYFLRHLTAKLHSVLQGALFVEGYSSSKQELWLVFRLNNGAYFQLKFNFIQKDTILSFPAEAINPKHKLAQFSALEALQVKDVVQHDYERSFHISFSNNYYLYIKLFGKNGNVLLIKDNTQVETFRKHFKGDTSIDFESIIQPKTIDVEGLLQTTPIAEIAKKMPFFPADALEEIQYGKTPAGVLESLGTSKFSICKMGEEYQLRFFSDGEVLGEYTNPIEAQTDFAKVYLGHYFFEDKKNTLVNTLRQRKEKLEKEIASKKLKQHTIATQTPYNHIGDILMANLHQLKKGEEKVRLLDFYTNTEIDIKLKKDISPQENAQNYYRKAKNQVKEVAILEQNLEKAEAELEQITAQLETTLAANDSKALRGLEKEKTPTAESTKNTLFKEFEKSGYTIWVGKNSENNDVLTLKNAAKADIWLHARGMAGSHVVIKTKPGKPLPYDVLEYAASLAAYFSKGRNDSLCPVIYTEKKYVRKQKGAHAGQVVVEKENTILVKPAFSDR